ncbi:helix-turn-helix transcriptional regulator [Streptomyces mirabilis]|uniref:helix-turn-helix transcriptional regulator n=1 Tax=Streptomyces mirabilis TaxID=68239 RepID=UPI0036E589D1
MTLAFNDHVNLHQTAERTVVDLAALGLAPLLALGSYQYLRAHVPRPPDRHRTMVVLALPMRGAFTFDVDGADHPVRPGQIIRVPPGCAYSTGRKAEPRGALVWLIARAAADSGPEDLRRALGVLADPAGPLVAAVDEMARDGLGRALNWADRPRDWIDEALLQHMVISAVLGATKAYMNAESPVSWPHQGIARVLAWIDEHLTEPVTTAELAALAGLSTSRFYEAFRVATGTSPKDYLLRRKTEYARQWLQDDPTVQVTAVAHSLGFSTSQRFATILRRYHGISPTACRTTRQGLDRTA